MLKASERHLGVQRGMQTQYSVRAAGTRDSDALIFHPVMCSPSCISATFFELLFPLSVEEPQVSGVFMLVLQTGFALSICGFVECQSVLPLVKW